MGSGTSVAKEASDIVLLDDAFPSIVKGIKWGRSLYKNIQSFLAFQLTVNVALCLTAIVGPMIGIEEVFGVIEILYVNLAMDSLGALALASEPAMDSVLEDKPRNNEESIISIPMRWFIGITGGVLFAIMLGLMIFDKMSILFATFMVFTWMNLFRARSFGKKLEGSLLRNKLFIGVSLFILITSICIVQFGGSVFETEALNLVQWVEVFGIALGGIVISELAVRLVKK